MMETFLLWVVYGVGGLFLLYLATRVVTSAFFRSKFEFHERTKHGPNHEPKG